MKAPVAVAAGLSLVAAAPVAAAVEREHSLSLGGGVAVLDIASKGSVDLGAGTDLAYSYGLTDEFDLMAEATWSVVALHEAAPKAPTLASTLNVGLGYVFDVIRWVPYIGLLAGPTVLSGGTVGDFKVVPEAVLAFGFDYRFDRTWSAGAAVRQYFFTDAADYPSYTQAFARVGIVWGW